MPIEEHILNYALLSKDIDIDIPGTQMTSTFEGQLHKKQRPFATKTRVIWGPGIYIYMIYEQCSKPWLVGLYRGLYYPLIWGHGR